MHPIDISNHHMSDVEGSRTMVLLQGEMQFRVVTPENHEANG